MKGKLNIVLLIAVIVLSVITYRQHNQISNLSRKLYICESERASLDRHCSSLENAIADLKSTLESIEDMDAGNTAPQKTYAEQKQEVIERIRRFNKERNDELERGFINHDSAVEAERRDLIFKKKWYKLDNMYVKGE